VKKGCLVGITILMLVLVIVAVSLAGLFYAIDRRAGISAASQTPWADFVPVSQETAVLARIDTSGLVGKLAPAMEKVPFPKWLSLYGAGSAGRAIHDFTPYYMLVALNIRPDLTNASLTIFINERRLGTLMAEMLTYDVLNRSLPQVKWNTEGAILHRRGALTIDGTLAIPPEVEPIIQEKWPSANVTTPFSLEEKPMIEAYVDNRAGQLVAIAGMILSAQNQDFQAMVKGGYGAMIMGVLPEIHSIHLSANLKDANTALVRFQANTTSNGQSLFLLLSGFWPMVPQNAQSRFGLTVEGEPTWDATQNAIVADLTITGIENLVVSRLTTALSGNK